MQARITCAALLVFMVAAAFLVAKPPRVTHAAALKPITTVHAIPAFSRMYGTSCSTCHLDFPKLNDFGKAFKDAGFKFPKDDD